MIRLGDALLLAHTKLRTRKIRTAFTVAIAGVLFGLVMAVVVITDGTFQSVDQFTKKSMTGRFIISGQRGYQDGDVSRDSTLIARALNEHKALIAEKKAEAKRLGIEYDASQDPSPVETYDGVQSLSYSSPISQKLIKEAQEKIAPTRTLDDFKKFAQNYHPIAYYTATSVQPDDGSLIEMKNGKEKFAVSDTEQKGMTGMPPDMNTAVVVPKALLTSYLMKDMKWQPANGRIPVIVSQKRAIEVTGYAAPKQDASASERLGYVEKLREKANGATFVGCYRNSASSVQIGQAINTAKEIEANKKNPSYQKPSLIYGLPSDDSCGAATIVRDVRSNAEKQYAEKLLQFERKFGKAVDPIQLKLTYEIVGVAPNGWADMDPNFSLGAKEIVTSLLTSQSFRFAIPSEMYDQLPNKASMQPALSETANNRSLFTMGDDQFFAEFSNATDARNFAKNESCQYGMSPGCQPKSKFFMMTPFGSNSVALDEVKHGVSIGLLWAIAVVTAIAALIAGLTIGRTIADGRRETAVFRAIGFKRTDITQVYVTYTLLLCLRIVIFALILGIAAAFLVNMLLWVDTTVNANLALGINDSTLRFSYIGFSERTLYVALAVFVAGVVGMIIPLLRNVRRNPIRDMRDE
jgi:hypothetical protein